MIEHLKEIVEALIFISQDPLTAERVVSVVESDLTVEDAQKAIDELVADYETQDRGIRILKTGGGAIFATKTEHDHRVRRLLQIERKNRLSAAALETLCTIAYNQNVTQSEISALRGVDSSGTLKTLLDKKLIKIVGRKKAPGNPLIYRTSEKFLQYFGLNAIEDLPSEEEIARILQEEKTSDQ
jgi:segregation and condensation protein B